MTTDQISLYDGEKRRSILNIERIFTYPNKDPYENFGKFEVQLIRNKVKKITDKGVDEGFFDEEDAISFEAELSYLVLHNYVDYNFSKIELSNLLYKYNIFFIKKYTQAFRIVGIALTILGDEI